MLEDKHGKVGEWQNRFDAEVSELDPTKQALEEKEAVLNGNFQDGSRLELVLEAVWAAMSRDESVIQDFSKSVCTGYTSLMRALM